jgi:hypothetical protein
MPTQQELIQQINTLLQQLATNARPPPQPVDKVLDAIEAMLFDRISIRAGANILLASDWDFVDPSRSMQTQPENVEDFLHHCDTDVGKYSNMYEPRQKLLKTICDAYGRYVRSSRAQYRSTQS